MSLCDEARTVFKTCNGDAKCLAEHGFTTTPTEDALEVKLHGFSCSVYRSARNDEERGEMIVCQGGARSVGLRYETS